MIKVSWIEDIRPPLGLDELAEKGFEPTFKKRTGLLLNCQKTMVGTVLAFVLNENGTIQCINTSQMVAEVEGNFEQLIKGTSS